MGSIQSAFSNAFRNEGVDAIASVVEMGCAPRIEAQARGDDWANGARFVGNSCPGRCSTLLNFAGMRRDLMPYLAKQATSLKLGVCLPGPHLPIVETSILLEEHRDFVVLLAWHYAKPIKEQLRARGGGVTSKLVMPLPRFEILPD